MGNQLDKYHNSLGRRYNRRHDGVTTIPTDSERLKLEEDRLRHQWDKFQNSIALSNQPGSEPK